MKIRILYFLFLILTTFACQVDDDEPIIDSTLEEKTMLDVSYGPHSQQVYDIYLPKYRSSETTKVLMLVHGGGWTSGDKIDMNAYVSYLKNYYPNYAIVNVNYILADAQHYAFPNQFQDLKKIVAKITAEKSELQIKPEIGMIGLSAGAHLAMMYDNVYDNTNQVKFVADIVGPSDFTDSFYDENFDIGQLIEQLIDPNAYPEGTNYLQELSPAFQVSNNSSPTCMFYGNQDPLVPASNGEFLQSKLNQFHIPNTLKIYNGGHGNDWSNTDIVEVQEIIGEYILNYLPN